ncbi:MAG: recombinase family protein [Candidatus Nomurabacteria bacterium]|nr:MAG: recombinase family protein [Candidatus Nomurabacteria bacterium]
MNIVREFVESKTAKEPGREIFNEMISRIEENEAEGILAWHPDRLARNSIDGGRIIYLVDTGKISALKFPTFGLIRHRKENLCCPSLLGNQNTMWIIFRKT